MQQVQVQVLRFKCTAADKERYRREAQQAGLSFSEYARRALDSRGPAVAAQAAAERAKAAELAQTREYIRRIGGLLNQLTRHAHTTKQMQDISRVYVALEQLRGAIEQRAAAGGRQA